MLKAKRLIFARPHLEIGDGVESDDVTKTIFRRRDYM